MAIRISIIVPVYNVERYLRRCLESIGSQDYPEAECIVVDDRSTDGSMDICRRYVYEYTGRIHFRIIQLEHNSGASCARNIGVKAATGDYICFVDSDDRLPDGALSNLAAAAEKHPGVDVVQGVAVLTDAVNYGGVAALHSLRHLQNMDYVDNPGEFGRLFMLFRIPSAPWNKLVRRELLIDNGIRFHPDIKIHHDWLWMYHLAEVINDFAVVHKPTYIYTSDAEGNLTNTPDMKRSLECWKTIFREVTAGGVPRCYGKEAAYRCLGLLMERSNKAGVDYGDIAVDFGRWLIRCGLRLKGLLLIGSHICPIVLVRKACNTILWRLSRHKFPPHW